MGMIKKTTGLEKAASKAINETIIPTAIQITVPYESGSDAAIERLSQSKLVSAAKPAYKARDFDAEARGKVKCVMFEAALQSPAIAGMRFDTMEEYLKLVEQAAQAGVEYTWK